MVRDADKRAPRGPTALVPRSPGFRERGLAKAIPAALGGRDGDPVLWGGLRNNNRLDRPPLRIHRPNQDNTRTVEFFPIKAQKTRGPHDPVLEVLVQELGDRLVFSLPLKPHKDDEEYKPDQNSDGE